MPIFKRGSLFKDVVFFGSAQPQKAQAQQPENRCFVPGSYDHRRFWMLLGHSLKPQISCEPPKRNIQQKPEDGGDIGKWTLCKKHSSTFPMEDGGILDFSFTAKRLSPCCASLHQLNSIGKCLPFLPVGMEQLGETIGITWVSSCAVIGLLGVGPPPPQ